MSTMILISTTLSTAAESILAHGPLALGFIGMPGPTEMIIIGIIAVLLFGSRLPSVMRNLGKGIVEFKKGVRGVEDEIESAASRSSSSYDDMEDRDEATAPKFEPPAEEPKEEIKA